jgi:hypothetical protein
MWLHKTLLEYFMYEINAVKEVLTFIQDELNRDSSKKAVSEGIGNCDTIMKYHNGTNLMRERKEPKVDVTLDLIDSENIGSINSTGEIRRRNMSHVCVHVCAQASVHSID